MRSAEGAELEAIRAWFRRLAEHVEAKDFAGARSLFAPETVAFGTFSDFLAGRDAVEREQWRKVWPYIEGFHWRAGEIRGMVSSDGLSALGMGCFESTGYDRRGVPYHRPGRATVALTRQSASAPWVACHTHMSLFRGVPQESFGARMDRGAER